MLPRRCRMTSPEDFRLVRQRGKHWRSEALVVSALAADPSILRFGFVVSRQVGTATTRNRLKRRLRAIVGSHFPSMRSGYDIVITARPLARDLSFDELTRILSSLLSEAGLLAAVNGGSTL